MFSKFVRRNQHSVNSYNESISGERQIFIWVVLIFIVSAIIRFFLIPHYRQIWVYVDELRYLDIARSLFYQGTISIRNTIANSQKILYPILLGPAMLFKNSTVQIYVIGILNAIYIESSVFPTYLIAKKLCKSHKSIIIAVLCTAILPDMCYSITFMSENVYIPITLWLLYVILKIFEATSLKTKLRLAFLGGILNYVLYLNKEVALAFILAYLFLLPFLWKERKDKGDFLAFFAYCFSFLLIFLIFKLTIFNGASNAYTGQIGLKAILTPYRFIYFLYCIIYNALFAIVAFMFFPVFIPFLNIKKIDRNSRLFYIYIFACLLITIVTIAFTISVREDLGYESMRQHTRYYGVLFIPFFICFLNWIEQNNILEKCSWLKFMLLSSVIACLIAGILVTIRTGTGVDSTFLKWWDNLCTFINQHIILISEGGGFDFNLGSIIVKCLFICFIILGAIGIYKFREITPWCIICIIFCVFFIDNYLGTISYERCCKVQENLAIEVSDLNDYLIASGGNCLYIMTDSSTSNSERIIDTYISFQGIYMTMENSIDSAILCVENLTNREFKTRPWSDNSVFSLDTMDYLLLRNDCDLAVDLNEFEYVELPILNHFKLYHNKSSM